MKKLLISLFYLVAGVSLFGTPQDVTIDQKNSTDTAWVHRIFSPAVNSILGFDGSKNAFNITLGPSLTLSGNVLNATGLSAVDWSTILNKPSVTITLTGAVAGSGTYTLGNNVTINTTAAGTSVSSVSINGASGLFGPLTFTNSPSVTMSVVGNVITFFSAGGGGGSGNVTSVSAGALSPLFTTSVSNPSTTPSIAFNLTNAGANTIFGNLTGGSAAPAYYTISSLSAALNLSQYQPTGNYITGLTGDVVANGPGSAAATIQPNAVTNSKLANPSFTLGTAAITLGTTTTSILGLNVASATILQATHTINGVGFNGSADITVPAAAGTLTGSTLNSSVTISSLTQLGAITVGVWQGTPITNSFISNPTITLGTSAVSLGGTLTSANGFNAATATALQTARAINGVSFDGTAAITVPASANTLTTNTLASGVTSSSLVTVGALSSGSLTTGFTVIANSLLANSAITIAGTSTSLGGSITQDTITGLASTGLIKRTGANTLAIAGLNSDYSGPVTITYSNSGSTGTASVTGSGIIINFPSAGAGTVTSVTSPNGTLSITGSTSAVLADLALGHSNAWTALQTFGQLNLTTLSSAGSMTISTTATNSSINISSTGTGSVNVSSQIALIGSGQNLLLASGTSTGSIEIVTGSLKIDQLSTPGFLFNDATGIVTSTTSVVRSAIGTANQVNVSGATGNVTFSLPQSIGTTSPVTFGSLTLASLSSAGLLANSAAGVVTSTSSYISGVQANAGSPSTGNITFTNSPTVTVANTAGVFSFTAAGGGTPAGSTGDVQFNTSGAFAADTGIFFYDTTNHRLGIGTSSPQAALHLAPSITSAAAGTTYADSITGTMTGTNSPTTHYARFNNFTVSLSSATLTNFFQNMAALTINTGSTVTNRYGYYFQTPTGSGTTTNQYPIFSEKGTAVFHQDAIGTGTSTAAVIFTNTTAAAAGAQQNSPVWEMDAQGWGTTTASSQTTSFLIQDQPVQGSANPSANWVMYSKINGGTQNKIFTISSSGAITTDGIWGITTSGNNVNLNGSFNDLFLIAGSGHNLQFQAAGSSTGLIYDGSELGPAGGTANLGANNRVWGPLYSTQLFVGANGATNASPLTGTISATSGNGTNIGGADFFFQNGVGTGTGSPGVLKFYYSTTTTSGSASQLRSLGLTVASTITSSVPIRIQAGTSGVNGNIASTIFDHYADAGNTTTTETDLYSDSVTGNTLLNNGDALTADYGLTLVSSATATREVRIYFGGTAIFDTGAVSFTTSGDMHVYVNVTRDSSTSVRYDVSATTTGASLGSYANVGKLTGLTLSSANTLKITGQAGSTGAATNDIVAIRGKVRYEPAF